LFSFRTTCKDDRSRARAMPVKRGSSADSWATGPQNRDSALVRPWELFPRFERDEFQVRETKTRMARKKLRKPSLQQPGTRGLRAKANLKPYVTLVSRSQGRVRGQVRADDDDDNDGDDAEEAEDRVFSNTGVGFEGDTGLKTIRDSRFPDHRDEYEDRHEQTTTTTATTRRKQKTEDQVFSNPGVGFEG